MSHSFQKNPARKAAALGILALAVGGCFAEKSFAQNAGGLVFIAGTTDKRFRAFDARTGKELWQGGIEAGGHATPITFRGKKTSKQYVVIAVGGGGYLRDLSPATSDALVAFALPN